ncbi:MAG TPA: hypothetical protein PLR32_02215 [candidate division Zixibacteria bacterium]|nr:hypothetical protein [candidate division Zixibacteria bacterium]MDD4918808.1 hypothetical protein [candidate division Zixibacteria bacterium]MDM7973613.1 hypothetical protein [candidate division Zixibacteria bacterium]HOZ07505.1 hypothetical protein [candidate division Zixibacteria bacterium]HPI32101.1 hypothetical protein [candidate division Zixibacteria bacterium]
MRKLFVTALLVFAVAMVFGFASGQVAAKGGGGGGTSCYYYCTCEGNPMKCCLFNGVYFCFPTEEIQCTQIYEC